MIETTTVASCIVAADLALKEAAVDLLELRIANGLGGQELRHHHGRGQRRARSVQAGARSAEVGGLARQVVIAKPHPDLAAHL